MFLLSDSSQSRKEGYAESSLVLSGRIERERGESSLMRDKIP